MREISGYRWLELEGSIITPAARKKASTSDQAIAEGWAAWERIQGNAKTTFSDWLLIGGCLRILRAQTMAEAKSNSRFGPRYQVAITINRLLSSHGLQDIDSHERRPA
jgi:hypothetical protein